MKITWRFLVTVAGTISLSLLLSVPARADGIDQYEAQRLVEKGEALPLEHILERHRERLRGRIIDLELEYEDGVLIYEIEMIDERGRVREYLIDARSGRWLGKDRL
ncbi:PepSY domain-containing protein [Motiliproteus sp. SC1-56]|uniref:PepSY domain-containing protein n=1 Tax=Motiliproteus sp. SC1-56 TaxID=2799565 RepID=UPI001A8D40B1|nr:PepSY domain-containing protein [Motiliproteus sp. SC1-56]